VLEDRTLLNTAPVLTVPQTTFSVVKTTALVVTVSATDKDSGQILTFSLLNAPAGASISSTQLTPPKGSAAVGTLAWTPTQDQGPASYPFTIVVTDNGNSPLSASQAVTVNTLAAGLVGNNLLIVGTSGNDTASVVAPTTANTISVTVNGATTGPFTVPAGGQIQANFFAGNDSFTVNESPVKVGPVLVVDGGTGTNSVIENSTSAADQFTVSGSAVSLVGAGDLQYANFQSLTVNALGGNDSATLTGLNPATATLLDGGTGTNTFTGTVAGNLSGSLTLTNFQNATMQVGGNFDGSLTANGSSGVQLFSVAGTISAASVIQAASFSNVTIGSLAGQLIATAGSIVTANVGTISATGLMQAVEVTGIPGSGQVNGATIGTISGSLLAGAINGLNVGFVNSGGVIRAAGQGTTDNVSIGTNSGSFTAPEDGTAGSGTMSDTTVGTNTGTISTGSISGMSVTSNSGSITAAGQGTTDDVSIGTNSGSFTAPEDGTAGSGTMSDTTIGTNTGTISTGSISGMSVTSNSGSITAAGQGTTDNVSIGTNSGSFTAPEDGTAGSGTMSDTTIGTNTGTISTGSISGMSVTSNSGSITAAGQGTTDNVSIGTNSGSFTAPEDGSAGSGTMSDTTIGTNTGTISTGSISGMSVTSNSGSITAAGQGTTDNVSIGTNSGSFTAPEDGSAGSGTMSDTTVGTNTGTISTGSISGMSVTSNSGSITAAGQGTTDNVSIGTNSGSFTAPEDGSAGSGTMSDTTIGTNTGTISTGTISGMSVTSNSGSITAAGQGSISGISIGSLSGTVAAQADSTPGSGTLNNSFIGTLTPSGSVLAASAANMTITTDAGTLHVTNTLTNLTTGTVLGTANLSAGHFTLVTAQHAAPIVNFIEPTVTRTLALTPHTGTAVPDYGFYYDGSAAGDPRVVVQINTATPVSFDLGVTTSATINAGAGFDLAGLYSVGNTQTGVHNVVVGGNLLLGAVPAGAVSFFQLPSGTAGGVQLPNDSAAVAIAGNAPAASIAVKSIAAIAAGTFGTVSADAATNTNALTPLAAGTVLVQANDSYQVFVSETNHVAQFLVTGPGGSFDSKKMVFADQVNDNRPVTATDFLVPSGSSTSVNEVDFTGQGASLTTSQPILTTIKGAAGASLGDLILSASGGITANITADSIIGNIDSTSGGISGVIQTTVGDLGRALTDTNGNITGVTYIHAGGGGLTSTGRIISAGNLVSQVNVKSGLDGVVAANGDIGVIQLTNGLAPQAPAALTRFGGIVVSTGGLNGQVVALGNVFGDISVTGGLGGRIAVHGREEFGLSAGQSFSRTGILGNVSIGGGISTTAAIVSAGLLADDGTDSIGNDAGGTHLTISGSDKGILAAEEDINFGMTGSLNTAGTFENVGTPGSPQYAGGANKNAIDYIFTNNGTALTIPGGLNLILQDLLALTVLNTGNLGGTTQ
jgi:hypothetical protein